MLLTITVPPELASPLTAEAARRGTTPEQLALDAVRRVVPAAAAPGDGSLLDFLGEFVGSVAGTGEPFSQNCGRTFADGLAANRPARP